MIDLFKDAAMLDCTRVSYLYVTLTIMIYHYNMYVCTIMCIYIYTVISYMHYMILYDIIYINH